MKRTLLALILILTGTLAFSQDQTKAFSDLKFFKDSTGVSSVSNGGSVTIVQDAKLEDVIYNYSRAFKSKPQKVWRVQIYFGQGRNGRAGAQSIKTNFENDYPGIPTYMIFEEPYFKVRVGDFDTRLEAESLKLKLLEEFDKIFIVEDTY